MGGRHSRDRRSLLQPERRIRRNIFIGCDFRVDHRALARMRKCAAVAKPAGWPGDDRRGILQRNAMRSAGLLRI
jgi:hypothetical protein